MATIYKVSKLPSGPIPDGVVYYSRTTKEILTNTPEGPKKFSALIVPKYVDFIPINGFFPLLTSLELAKSYSPTGTVTAYGLAELGPPPPGVTYPVYMPNGRSDQHLGDYIDPLGDDDGDGVINFRDPDIIGLAGLPSGNYKGVDPFITSNGNSFNILDYLNNPDAGTLNDTSDDILIPISSSGIIVGPNGELKVFFGPGIANVKPGWTLFQEKDPAATSPLPEPTPAYSGTDPFVTSGGVNVNIQSFLGAPDKGSHNNTGSDITIDSIYAGMIVCADGSFSLSLPGTVTIPNGCTFFRDIGNTTSPLSGPTPAYTGDPFVAQALTSSSLPSSNYNGTDPFTTVGLTSSSLPGLNYTGDPFVT
jgi:hypothetical protein